MRIHRSRTGEPSEDGYTLIELLVVLAIIGLAVLAVPTLLNGAIPSVQSKSAARTLASDLRLARDIAVSRGEPVRVIFGAEKQTYGLAGRPARSLPYATPFTQGTRRDSFEIDFFPDGSSNGGVVTVGTAGHQHKVATDWLTGRVSVDE